MNVLDLFSGIGGFSLGLERAGMKTVAFCEINDYCQRVLAKNFPARPIFSDIRTLTKESLSGIGINSVDLVCGGFPCQPFSIAGKKRATQDDRDLWPEMFRVIAETRPTWVIGENVANFVGLAFTRSKLDLESLGYTVRPFIIPACAVGAQHRRDRVWILAYLDRSALRDGTERGPGRWPGSVRPEGETVGAHDGTEGIASDSHGNGGQPSGLHLRPGRQEQASPGPLRDGNEGTTPNAHGNGFSGQAAPSSSQDNEGEWESHWRAEAASAFGHWFGDQPGVGRDIHGISDRVDPNRRERVAALGNTIMPQIAEVLGRAIMAFQNSRTV